MNALHILDLYFRLKENPALDIKPRTFIFGAKAASAYYMAKQIIRFICTLGKVINNDPDVNGKLKVVFLENYRVTLAELIMPAAEVSEQISVAGKEASGTGNMKFMINGALTVGTLDGANVEIHEEVGDENIFLFGLHADEVQELWKRGYNPTHYYQTDARIKRVIDALRHGIGGVNFSEIADSLTIGRGGTPATATSSARWTRSTATPRGGTACPSSTSPRRASSQPTARSGNTRIRSGACRRSNESTARRKKRRAFFARKGASAKGTA